MAEALWPVDAIRMPTTKDRVRNLGEIDMETSIAVRVLRAALP
jgi:hypothetical protein